MNQEDKGGGVERILNLIYTPVNYFVFILGDLNMEPSFLAYIF